MRERGEIRNEKKKNRRGEETDDRLLGAPSQSLSVDGLKFKSRCCQTSAMASKTRGRGIGFMILIVFSRKLCPCR